MGNTILLADKSITIQKIVELTFSDENYQIKCVNDGQSALDAISAVRPSIILADINLPVKSGYEVCQAVRTDPAYAEFSHVPVILLAGIYETMDEDRARLVEEKVREVGANDLLSKPFDPQMLTSKVKELMGEGDIPQNTAEIPIPSPSPFLETPDEQGGIFSKVPESAIPPVEPSSEMPPPPDDSEKTMMLPSPLSFTGNMFAETPPMEESIEPEPDQHTVPVETVSPMNEPVFEMGDMESAPQPELVEEPEPEPELADLPEEEPADGLFAGREEVEFSFDTQPGVASKPARTIDDTPFVSDSPFDDAEPMPAAAPPAAGFEPATDDPFGDVFSEPMPQTWQTGAFDEESPFGMPEPTPPPPPPEPPAPPREEEITHPRGLAMDDAWSIHEPVVEEESLMEEDESGTIEPDTGRDDSQAVLEEIMAVPELKPEFGEDTWSRARKVAEGPVEELFESEVHSEEPVELQPDLSDNVAVEDPVSKSSAQEVAQPSASSGGAVEITDELIDRIAARVVAKLSERVVSEIVWQVVPDLAEKMIRRELEKLNTGDE